MNRLLLIFLLIPFTNAFGQSYAPEPGQPGSTAIHKDSSIIQYWADSASITRGPMNIANPGLGNASYGIDSDAYGVADGSGIVSLGDGGEALIYFEYPISNGAGPDFAIFENGFIDHYMEFAFVEVSSDGLNFFRFDAVSEIPTDTQLTNFSTSNCAYVHNLAGKYRVEYGTPFDLEDMTGIAGLDVNSISHIKLIDVVGSIDPNWGTTDSQGNLINDPYPTEFEPGGFDLDAVAVINSQYLDLDEIDRNVSVYPNPFNEKITVRGADRLILYDLHGNLILDRFCSKTEQIDMHNLISGIYLLKVETEQGMQQIKLMKL